MTVLIRNLIKWLGYDGLAFFHMCYEEYGRVDPVWVDCGIPHAVHFREGMAVRNFLRQSGFCNDWSDHDFDNRWKFLVKEALNNCTLW